jgi:hypothetical protein
MASEQMSQAEIDALLQTITAGDPDVSSDAGGNIDRRWSNAVGHAKGRLDFARQNLNADEVREARDKLHFESFNLWLVSHGMERGDYYRLMRQAIKREGLFWFPFNPPGWKLLYADGSPWTGKHRA